MRLNQQTDYALRMLMYLGTNEDKRCTIADVAAVFAISENHLMKVANILSRSGLSFPLEDETVA